jgi:hypothetical protein
MLHKFRKSKMSSVEFTATTKSALKALIEREAIRTGSRTVAYEVVAQTIGASSSWVRKFLTYDDKVAEPRITLFHNISTYYNNVCERIEAENRTDELRLRQLRGKMDAVAKSIGPKGRD